MLNGNGNQLNTSAHHHLIPTNVIQNSDNNGHGNESDTALQSSDCLSAQFLDTNEIPKVKTFTLPVFQMLHFSHLAIRKDT